MVDVYLKLNDTTMKMFEEMRDRIITEELAEFEQPKPPAQSSSHLDSPLSIQQLLRNTISNSAGPSNACLNPFAAPAPPLMNPFQLALCQSLATTTSFSPPASRHSPH
ncbi:unnamed protein product [Caenorhabditis bovis]|uniref:Uncharacterized protein n=1 Tax=Caenorhabditis bovis TaxID=2654633 RepID=A0A8S1F6D0_9PELO|nr:unnamed protein product [Caenorhabditis bovis]